MRITLVGLLALVLTGCACFDRPSPPIKAPQPRKVAAVKPPPTPPVVVAPVQAPEPVPGYVPTKQYPCDCPDDRAIDGSRCGARSACLRKNGRVPFCPGYQCR